MTADRNRQSGFKNRLRRVCAATILALMTAPITGCSEEFFGGIFLSLGCAFGAAGPDNCTDVRLNQAAQRFQLIFRNCRNDCSTKLCPLRPQLLELAGEECYNQQDHWQISTTPGEPNSSFQCKLSADAQDALNIAEKHVICPGDAGWSN